MKKLLVVLLPLFLFACYSEVDYEQALAQEIDSTRVADSLMFQAEYGALMLDVTQTVAKLSAKALIFMRTDSSNKLSKASQAKLLETDSLQTYAIEEFSVAGELLIDRYDKRDSLKLIEWNKRKEKL